MVADEDKKKEEKFQYKKSLFGQLSRHQVENLFQNYKVDFEMFGYDIEEFLGYLDWMNYEKRNGLEGKYTILYSCSNVIGFYRYTDLDIHPLDK